MTKWDVSPRCVPSSWKKGGRQQVSSQILLNFMGKRWKTQFPPQCIWLYSGGGTQRAWPLISWNELLLSIFPPWLQIGVVWCKNLFCHFMSLLKTFCLSFELEPRIWSVCWFCVLFFLLAPLPEASGKPAISYLLECGLREEEWERGVTPVNITSCPVILAQSLQIWPTIQDQSESLLP